MQERKEFKGLYAKSYLEWRAIFADRSTSLTEKADMLRLLTNCKTVHAVVVLLGGFRSRFFPDLVGNTPTKRPAQRATEKQEREEEFQNTSPVFKKLSKLCAEVGLVVTTLPMRVHKRVRKWQFDIGGLKCFVNMYTSTYRPSRSSSRYYVKVGRPQGEWQKMACDFLICFVDVDTKEAEHEAVYFFPVDAWPAEADLWIPVSPAQHSHGPPRKFDPEQYRDEKGLALLVEAAKKKQAEMAKAKSAA